jgi:hypothetical protein
MGCIISLKKHNLPLPGTLKTECRALMKCTKNSYAMFANKTRINVTRSFMLLFENDFFNQLFIMAGHCNIINTLCLAI